ncbi:MAG: polysaccharide deacetylase family protein [Betaproteobacteria bacterium]|nr:polysaccharide deacetylase family protein [Betaproteobacteria bacterium]MDH3438607.1 polysaccharide deacetylase family protein [Betaproteobacteria bacterium]
MELALKIDVDTYRGTRDSVPRLLQLLDRHGVRATFLFSLGPDHTGRAIRRVFRPGFLSKVSRSSVVSSYGITTLLYGTLLPGPDIGRRCADVMRAAQAAGHDVGIHTYDHVKWQDGVARADYDWTLREMRLACERFQEIFGEPARVHGAAGWQMNRYAFRLTQRLGFRFCSDTRGTCPFVPIYDAEIVACPQLPTTLPTLDELIGTDGVTVENVARHLLSLTEGPVPTGHVYTLHAELEGNRLTGIFEELLTGWQAQGYSLITLNDYADGLDISSLPRCVLREASIPGRTGTLTVQGPEFLA